MKPRPNPNAMRELEETIRKSLEVNGLNRDGTPIDPPPGPKSGELTDEDVAKLVDENGVANHVGTGKFTVSTPPDEAPTE